VYFFPTGSFTRSHSGFFGGGKITEESDISGFNFRMQIYKEIRK
jgi:hypothetical protein